MPNTCQASTVLLAAAGGSVAVARVHDALGRPRVGRFGVPDAEIAARASRAGVPRRTVVGRDGLDARAREQLGPASIREATTLEAIADAGSRICRQARARATAAPAAEPPAPDAEMRGHAAPAG